jgi:hypothetical protein
LASQKNLETGENTMQAPDSVAILFFSKKKCLLRPQTSKPANQNSSVVKYSRQNDLMWTLTLRVQIFLSPIFTRQKAVFHGIYHICTELLQKTDSQRLLRPWLDTSASLVFFGQKLSFSRCLHQGLIFTDLEDFLYGVY